MEIKDNKAAFCLKKHLVKFIFTLQITSLFERVLKSVQQT